MNHSKGEALTVEQLYHRCDLGQLDFETTAEVEDLEEILGQPRALQAISFGMGIEDRGYNIFALGPAGTGKRELVTQFFEERAASDPVAPDWCYVNNFEETHKPHAIELPAGKGIEFREDMEHLINEIQTALSAAFESEEYQMQRQGLMEEFKERQSQAFRELQEKAEEEDVALIRTPAGIAVAPVREGEVLSPQEVQALSEEERQRLEGEIEDLQEELQKIVRQVPSWQREMQERLDELNHEMAEFAVAGLFDELREKYTEHEEVVEHLNAVQDDVVEHAGNLVRSENQGQGGGDLQQQMAQAQQAARESALMRRYKVNVIVDNSELEGAPVIHEGHPTYQNLIGRVEHRAQMGALLTDFNLIKAGALHRANGGYLILDARKVLTQPYAWEGLKRALQDGKMHIESVGQMLSLISTVSLEPEPIPLKVRVALFAERLLYYLLYQLDPEFSELFKVMADFAEQMDWTEESQQLYARLIATMARRQELRPFSREAVARVIERSARLVGDAEKLTARTRDVRDLLQEANYWAGERERDVVSAEDVQRAIEARIYRADRLRERMQEEILRGTFLIDTTGEEPGQVNGLSVLRVGDFTFGRPTRITARVRLGSGEVIDIEREVELGGPIHSKGVLILSGFMGGRYAEEHPLSLSASLVFEQSYAGVEGDSASSAELYALLSAIAEVPLRQSLAVTGSVNQRGQVQAIGGVNEKIEGFFDICQARGLTGDQGVLIPESNVKHLMLREDVVAAVQEGKFHIYPITHVDEGLELLTGLPAGERDEEGRYPEGSLNARVEQRLLELAEQRKAYAPTAREEEV